MNKTKKILSIILAVMMILTAVPLASLTAFAEKSYDPSTATLTISVNFDLRMSEDFEASFPGCKKIVISEEITVIGDRAFLGLPIESVELPSTLTSIGDSAFRNCGNLKSIVIPSGVTSIGSQTFDSCVSLESVVIPDSVTSIGNSAFSGCTTLESIEIPDSVTSIGNSAFSGCKSLKSIKLPSGLKIIPDNMLSGAGSLESIEIPDSVTSIGESAFTNAGLKKLTIPANVESIGYMFIDCCPIKCLEFLGQPTTGLDNDLFYYVGNEEEEDGGPIAELILPESWSGEPAGSTGDTFTWLDGVFTFNHIDADNDCICDNCGYDNSFVIDENGVLTAYNGAGGNVVIPDSVKSIADYVFNGKTSITGITIPDSVTTIGNYAFANCKGVSEIIIPDSVTSIGNYAFAGCQETSLSIGNKVETIGNGAFVSNSKLLSVTIPDSVKSIGFGAFQNCSALADLTIGSGVKTIGDSAFEYSSIKEVTIPGNVETISASLFANCTALKEVTICDGVSKISNNAFINCSKITDLVISDSVKEIGSTAFCSCSSLKTLTISDNVTSLGSGAFSSCSSLETVFYPCSSAEDSVKNIMSTYGNYTYTQLDHDFVNGICTICGDEEFDLDAYKQSLYDDFSIFIDDNISRDMQKLDSYQEQVGKIFTAVEAAETKDEVDEIRAQAFQTLDEFIPDEYTVTVQGAGTRVGQELNTDKSTKYYQATVTISYPNGINDKGEWFVYWLDADTNEIVSSYSTYRFFVTRDITLVPVYVDPGEHEEHPDYYAERNNAVITTRMDGFTKNVGGTFSLFSEYSVSKIAMPKVQGHGIICTTDDSLATETSLVCGNDAVEKYAAVKTSTDYVGTQKTILEVTEPTTVYTRSYIIDGDGNIHYSEIKEYFLDTTPPIFVDGYEDEIVFCGAENYSLDVAEADEVVPTAVETETETAETASWFTTLISFFTTIINWFMQILGI